MINKLSVRIWVADAGIRYSSLFKKLDLQWKEIESIGRKCHLDLGMMRGREHLEIRTTNNKTIRVIDYIMNCETMDSGEGLSELETVVKKFALANCPTPVVAATPDAAGTLAAKSISGEYRDEETVTRERRQNVIFQMILLPLICLILIHYFARDLQEMAELAGYATLIFLTVMLVIRKMLILESQGKLTRRASVLTAVAGSAFLVLIHLLLRRKDYANVSVLFVFTVEVIMYLSYIYLKRGTLHFPSLEQPSDENASGPTRKGSV